MYHIDILKKINRFKIYYLATNNGDSFYMMINFILFEKNLENSH